MIENNNNGILQTSKIQFVKNAPNPPRLLNVSIFQCSHIGFQPPSISLAIRSSFLQNVIKTWQFQRIMRMDLLWVENFWFWESVFCLIISLGWRFIKTVLHFFFYVIFFVDTIYCFKSYCKLSKPLNRFFWSLYTGREGTRERGKTDLGQLKLG